MSIPGKYKHYICDNCNMKSIFFLNIRGKGVSHQAHPFFGHNFCD